MIVELSLVIPTYNESENILPIIDRLINLLDRYSFEIIVVDDNSPDRTWEIVETYALNRKQTDRIRVLRRFSGKSLSLSVVEGFSNARGQYLGVMDADLSHDPEIIIDMIDALRIGAEISVGSRRVPGGGIDGWPWYRRLFSEAATAFSRRLLGLRVRDPMSGFFFMKKSVFERLKGYLRPRGYKILLEFVARTDANSIVEIPYRFKDRQKGQSKLSGIVVMDYFLQTLILYRDRLLRR